MRTSLWLAMAIGDVLVDQPAARACGGFFCSAATPVPIYQAGERVLFVRDGDATIMHVEVTYSGDPTSFAWLVPLPGLPLGPDGKPLPLDGALRLRHSSLFPALENGTAPTYALGSSSTGQGCNKSSTDDSVDASEGSESEGGRSIYNYSVGSAPSVFVLQEATVGPYDARVIEAKDAGALFDWLEANGYSQDESARPILEQYALRGYVFLALRLKNDKDVGDLRPIALRLAEDSPCVPLRLTAIAATPNMPILAFVLGPSRAVPKNLPRSRGDGPRPDLRIQQRASRRAE